MFKKVISIFTLSSFLLVPSGMSAKADGPSRIIAEPRFAHDEKNEIFKKLNLAARSIKKSVCKLSRATPKDRAFADYLSQYPTVLYQLIRDIYTGQVAPANVQAEMSRRLLALPDTMLWRDKWYLDESNTVTIHYGIIEIYIFSSGFNIYEREKGAPPCGWTRQVVNTTLGGDWGIDQRPADYGR